MPQPHGRDEAAVAHSREGETLGGRLSVAQALAGAHLTVVAKAGIEQRLARDDVRGALAADREPSGLGYEGNGGLPQGSHGTSVLAPGRGGGRRIVCKFAGLGREPADRLPPLLSPTQAGGGESRPGARPQAGGA